MITTRWNSVATTLTRVAAATVMAMTLASAGTASASAPTDAAGFARFGHFAPTAAAVDVLVDGAPFASGIGFKDVSEYQSIPAGVHTFELRASTDPEGPTLLSIQASVPEDGAITVAAVSVQDGVAPQVFDDVLTMPQDGQALVRFIHAAPDAAAVDISVRDGDTLAAGVPYPQATDYLDIAPGEYDVVVTDSDTGDVVLEVDGWSIEAGVQSTIAVVAGVDGMLDVAPVVDAAAMSLAPVGGVQTGYGGMSGALESSSNPAPFLMALALTALIISATAASLLRRSPVTTT